MEDYTDFLANSLALGLTVVCLIPQISASHGLKNDMFNPNTLLVLVLFLGLIFSLPSYGIADDRLAAPDVVRHAPSPRD